MAKAAMGSCLGKSANTISIRCHAGVDLYVKLFPQYDGRDITKGLNAKLCSEGGA